MGYYEPEYKFPNLQIAVLETLVVALEKYLERENSKEDNN